MLYSLFLASYGLKFYTMINVSIQLNKLNTSGFWWTMVNLQENDEEAQIYVYETFYWLNEGSILVFFYLKKQIFVKNTATLKFLNFKKIFSWNRFEFPRNSKNSDFQILNCCKE